MGGVPRIHAYIYIYVCVHLPYTKGTLQTTKMSMYTHTYIKTYICI